MTTTGSAQTGAFTLTITGSSGALTHSTTATLNVNAAGGGGTGPWTRVEENNAAVQFNGDWFVNSNANNSGGTARLTLVNSVIFTFTGSGARWVGFSDPWSGMANVYVDGTLKSSIDTYSATAQYQAIQYTITGLPSGQHTLKVQAAGEHDSQAQSSWVWVDAFDYMTGAGTTGNPDFSLTVAPSSATVSQGGSVTYTVSVSPVNGFNGAVLFNVSGLGSGASASFNPTSITGSGTSTLTITTTAAAQTGAFTLTVTGSSGGLVHSATATLNVNSSGGSTIWNRVEEGSTAVRFIGDWFVNSSPNHTGGSAYLTLANSVVFTFSGTGARWVGFSDPWSGIANVYVDGVLKATVDTYSATTKYQVIQYTITGLSPGTHTLKIVATGQHDSAAASSWVWVDAFDYTTN
jgi:hypothetical protein